MSTTELDTVKTEQAAKSQTWRRPNYDVFENEGNQCGFGTLFWYNVTVHSVIKYLGGATTANKALIFEKT